MVTQKKTNMHASRPATASSPVLPIHLIVGGIVVLVVAAWAFGLFGTTSPPTLIASGELDAVTPTTYNNSASNLQLLKSSLSKEKFLKSLYKIDRENYDLYEQAAEHLGLSLEETQQFFFDCCDLTKESDIFAQLPPIPDDFAEVAYGISIGTVGQIGLLNEGYSTQPEFFTFVNQETGVVSREFMFKGYTDVDLSQWVDHGIQAYPADQYDTLSKSGRTSFRANVFITNVWNNQNFEGINLVANSKAYECFDLTIAEDSTGKSYFLLGPTFPYFHRDWATKVVIEGVLKPNAPLGDCLVQIDPVAPPSELSSKWSSEHPGIYVPYGFLHPSDSYINLHITITE